MKTKARADLLALEILDLESRLVRYKSAAVIARKLHAKHHEALIVKAPFVGTHRIRQLAQRMLDAMPALVLDKVAA